MKLKNLRELDLSEGQVAVYSAVLELGISGLNKIQEKTGIERRNIYDILNKLIEKGLISYTVERGRKTYQCIHPRKISEEIKKKKNSLTELEEQIPNMINLFEQVKPDIRAEIFRGNEAIKALHEDILNYNESFWMGGNSSLYDTALKTWFNHWMKRRAEKKHWMHDLVDKGTWLEELMPGNIEKHKKNCYKYCELPQDMASPMVVIIFGNKVPQCLWREQQPFAFVLESPEIKESFMKQLNHFWKEPY